MLSTTTTNNSSYRHRDETSKGPEGDTYVGGTQKNEQFENGKEKDGDQQGSLHVAGCNHRFRKWWSYRHANWDALL
jgi:hypothetical protein